MLFRSAGVLERDGHGSTVAADNLRTEVDVAGCRGEHGIATSTADRCRGHRGVGPVLAHPQRRRLGALRARFERQVDGARRAGFDDPTGGTWKVTKVRADAGDRMDTLTITLTRQDGPGNTRLDVQRMAARDVELTTGLGAPAAAKAIVISFGGDVVADEAFTGTPALKAIDSFDVESLGDGVFAVVGVNRDGCFRLSAPTWAEGADAAPGDTITLLLDVRYK